MLGKNCTLNVLLSGEMDAPEKEYLMLHEASSASVGASHQCSLQKFNGYKSYGLTNSTAWFIALARYSKQ
jgi:hypothetical protein